MFPCGQRYDIYGRQLRNSYGKLLNSPYQTVFEKGKKKLDKKEKEKENKNKQKNTKTNQLLFLTIQSFTKTILSLLI